MSRVTLHGTVWSDTLSGMQEQALEKAKAFFGTDCVSVRITTAQEFGYAGPDTPSGYEASFRAREHHRVERPSYGPPRCLDCKMEWYAGETPVTADWPRDE